METIQQITDFLLQVYCLGTILSMQIPFVGFQPVQSSEHMAVSMKGGRVSLVLTFAQTGK